MSAPLEAGALPLSSRGARLVVWSSFAIYICLAAWTIDGVRIGVPTVIGLAVLAGSCLLMTLDTNEPMRRVTALIAVVVGPVDVVVIVPHLIRPGYSEWYLGAAAFVCFYVALRGQRAVAWIGFAAMLVAAVICYTSLGRELSTIFLDMARHAGVLLVGTIFSIGFANTSSTIAALGRDAAARTALAQATETAAAVREERLEWLEQLAGDLLRRIASGEPLSDADRRRSARVEAELRDSLRGRALYREPLVSTVRAARARGAQVTVLDDGGGGYDSVRLDEISALIAEQLETANAGKVTVRLLPPDRDVAVTIVFDGDRARRVELT